MSDSLPGYVVIEGPIGVGKTSLARKLADDFTAELVLEQADENPFLEQFYAKPREAALSTQLHFLLQRAKQAINMRQGQLFSTSRVADYLLEKDQLFAKVNLTASEFELYNQVYEHLTIEAPQPDLVVYLQAPISTLIERIKKRGRYIERNIESAYLEQLNETYAEFFYYYNDAPLLIVNAGDSDFINNEHDYSELRSLITQTRGGRHYFNPLPFAS